MITCAYAEGAEGVEIVSRNVSRRFRGFSLTVCADLRNLRETKKHPDMRCLLLFSG
jgi:hypothetical protein